MSETASYDLPASDAELRARAAELVRKASEAGLMLGTAESCTGGLVSQLITSVPGSSACMMGSVVSYACSVKRDILGVDQAILDSVGAVSEECARAMAVGARRALGCDIAVSVTGIAGPGGAVPGKPLGTVWFAAAGPEGVFAEKLQFTGDRDEVRAKTARHAIELIDGCLV